MHRFEIDVITGTQTEVRQVAYIGPDGDTMVLDADQSPPAGYEEYEPQATPAD